MTVNQTVLDAALRLKSNPNVKVIADSLFGKNGVNVASNVSTISTVTAPLPVNNSVPAIREEPPVVKGKNEPKSARKRGKPPPSSTNVATSVAPPASTGALAANAAPASTGAPAANATPASTGAPAATPTNLSSITGINNDAVEATRTMEEAKEQMVKPQSTVRSISGIPPVNVDKAFSREKLNALAASATMNPLLQNGGRRSVKTKRKARRTRNKKTRRTKAKKSRSRR